jgi:hypothetical protein
MRRIVRSDDVGIIRLGNRNLRQEVNSESKRAASTTFGLGKPQCVASGRAGIAVAEQPRLAKVRRRDQPSRSRSTQASSNATDQGSSSEATVSGRAAQERPKGRLGGSGAAKASHFDTGRRITNRPTGKSRKPVRTAFRSYQCATRVILRTPLEPAEVPGMTEYNRVWVEPNG